MCGPSRRSTRIRSTCGRSGQASASCSCRTPGKSSPRRRSGPRRTGSSTRCPPRPDTTKPHWPDTSWLTPVGLTPGRSMDRKQRISYLPLEAMDDEMRAEMERCQREGTPRPESSAVRAHVPACFWAFARSWESIFRDGVCDHAIKELCRVYVSRSVKCEYCGNQRSEKARAQGLTEGQYDDLLNFQKSARLSDREKAALAYAEAITWRLEPTDALWERLHEHFSEPELVELGCFV